ncbi:MAG: FtsX-like permease family protein [Firmicutes bacterium]|jgi:ABC-type antimicrobial peptide transport system permease subunit|nr:FtsX-like permease family protein [Bacillota bacterium]
MTVGSRFEWSLRHTKQRLFESLLIILAIGLGVAVIVTILSLFIRTRSEMAHILEYPQFRTFEIRSPADQLAYHEMPPIRMMTEEDRLELEVSFEHIKALQSNLPEGMHVYIDGYQMLVQTPLIESDAENESSSQFYGYGLARNSFVITETTVGYYLFYQPKLSAGSWFMQEDVDQGNRVIVLGHRLAERLFPEGDALGKKVPVEHWAGSIEYEVIGVLSADDSKPPYMIDQYADVGFIPLNSSPYEGVQAFSSINIGVEEGIDLQQAFEVIQAEVALQFGDAAVVRSNLADFEQTRAQQVETMLLIGGLASVGLVVAVINILNLILARVLRRTKSIGLALALGSSRRMIFEQFLLESLVLGLFGAGFGIVLSFAADQVLLQVSGGSFVGQHHWIRVLLGCGLGVLVSLLFGVYPAYQGSRVDPADALRSD